ncbi:Sec-independent protein translocase protein TatB [Desulfolithobacter sp.]
MFGIGLPEMIVILAVALIVVGPDKLPDLARSLAKGVFELKKTMNEVKASLTEESEVLGEVHGELKKTTAELQEQLLDNETQTWKRPEPETPKAEDVEVIDLQPVEQRPWEADALTPPGDAPVKDKADVDAGDQQGPDSEPAAREPEIAADMPRQRNKADKTTPDQPA